MARQTVTLGGTDFASRTAAQRAVQDLIRRSRDDVPLAGADLRMAEDLLAMHPQAEWKTRNGKSAIVATKAAGHVTRCLAVVDDFGAKEEFSFAVALGLKPCWPLFPAAARRAVAAAVEEHKKSAFAAGPVSCAVSGVPLAFDEAHVDHAPPWTFEKIVEGYRTDHGEPPLEHQGNEDRFADPADRDRFVRYHDERASLRIVHRRENLSGLRRGAR